jgi:methanogenic corrinoid protein MtbC1
MDEGLTISRVVAMLGNLREANDPVTVDVVDNGIPIRQYAPLPPSGLIQPLIQALTDLDDDRADEIVEQAFALYTMPTVYVELIAPTLVEIGEAWRRGDVLVCTEHFATTYLRGRLLAVLQSCSHHPEMPMVFVGCAPTEPHEVGALIFAVMLRQQGFNAVYLGQDVPLEDLTRAAEHQRPAMVCLSANSPAAALQLRDAQSQLARIEPPPAPLFGYGGRAFDTDPDIRRTVGGHYLGADPRDALNVVTNLVRAARRS